MMGTDIEMSRGIKPEVAKQRNIRKMKLKETVRTSSGFIRYKTGLLVIHNYAWYLAINSDCPNGNSVLYKGNMDRYHFA